jgi:hypothetical protein
VVGLDYDVLVVPWDVQKENAGRDGDTGGISKSAFQDRSNLRSNGKGEEYGALMELLAELLAHGGAISPTDLLLCGLPSSYRKLCTLLQRRLGLTACNCPYTRSCAGGSEESGMARRLAKDHG